MKCPHCSTTININMHQSEAWEDSDFNETGKGYQIAYGHCLECKDLIVMLRRGTYQWKVAEEEVYSFLDGTRTEEVLYPKHISRKVEPEVPERHSREFAEACAILPVSPKASAALSRRILQDILREQFPIKHQNLANEIEEFINLKDVPSYLAEAVDAIRNVGNFAAHPSKNTHTGEIVDVEIGESEWLLDVLEALFEFTFVQPKKLAERKNNLDTKLKSIGKPPMKNKKPQQE